MSKNDLSAFRRKPTAEKVLTDSPPVPTKLGAPKKPAKEKLSKRAQTMLTKAEFDRLEEERGAIPMSAYLRLKLKEVGII